MSSKDNIKPENEDFNIDVEDEELARSVDKGVMEDNPNYQRLLFWSILGTTLFVIFVYMLASIYDFNNYLTQKNVSEGSSYYQIEELNEKAEEKLTTFGVVDDEEGIYRIPIDSAITTYIEENN